MASLIKRVYLSLNKILQDSREQAQQRKEREEFLAPLIFRLRLSIIAFLSGLIAYIAASIYQVFHSESILFQAHFPQSVCFIVFVAVSMLPNFAAELYQLLVKHERVRMISFGADLVLSITTLAYFLFGRSHFEAGFSSLIIYDLGLFVFAFLIVGFIESLKSN